MTNIASSKTILVVDDEIHLREILRFILETNNFSVIEAENGKVGLQLAIEKKPDAILSDLLMPVMTGFSMLEKLREANQNTPLIFISAFSDQEKMIKAQTLGVTEFISKPFSEEKLLESLNKTFSAK